MFHHTLQVGGAHWLADRPPVAAPEYADGEPQEVDAQVEVTAQYDVGPGGTVRALYNINATNALPAKLPPGLFRCALAQSPPPRPHPPTGIDSRQFSNIFHI